MRVIEEGGYIAFLSSDCVLPVDCFEFLLWDFFLCFLEVHLYLRPQMSSRHLLSSPQIFERV